MYTIMNLLVEIVKVNNGHRYSPLRHVQYVQPTVCCGNTPNNLLLVATAFDGHDCVSIGGGNIYR